MPGFQIHIQHDMRGILIIKKKRNEAKSTVIVQHHLRYDESCPIRSSSGGLVCVCVCVSS